MNGTRWWLIVKEGHVYASFVSSLWADPAPSVGELKPSALLDFLVRLVSFPETCLSLSYLSASLSDFIILPLLSDGKQLEFSWSATM